MSFQIRQGEKKDAEAIFNLIRELAVFEKDPEAVEISVQDLINDGFSEIPRFMTFVAEEEDGKIIGMALFYERYSTWKGKTIHLEDLMVTAGKRGRGAGKELYGAVMKYAYQNGYNRVVWEVLDWNMNAIEFYKNTGAVVFDEWRVAQMDQQNLERFIHENF